MFFYFSAGIEYKPCMVDYCYNGINIWTIYPYYICRLQMNKIEKKYMSKDWSSV